MLDFYTRFERIKIHIKKILKERPQISIIDLKWEITEKTEIGAPTIDRYLAAMEEQGIIERREGVIYVLQPDRIAALLRECEY